MNHSGFRGIMNHRALGLDQGFGVGVGTRNVGCSKAHGAVVAMHSLFDVMRCPSSLIFEETDATDSSIIA
jgi:hypothetical protein